MSILSSNIDFFSYWFFESINSMATVVIMEVEGTTAEDMVDTVMVDVSHHRLPSMKIMLMYCFSSPEYFVHRRSRLLRRILLDYGMRSNVK